LEFTKTRSGGVREEHIDCFEKKEGETDRPIEKEGNHSLGSNPNPEQLVPTVGPREFEGRRK